MKILDVLKIQFRIFRSQSIAKFIIIISLFLSIFLGFITLHSSSFTGSLSLFSLMKGYKNGFNFSLSLTHSVYRILIFFIIIMASTSVSDEAQKGTLKTILVKRLKRGELIVGKSLFLLIFFSALIAVIFFLSLATGGILFGFSDISEKNYLIHSTASLFLNSFLSLFLMILPLSALINLCLFFSVLFNNNLLPIICNFSLNFIFYIFTELDFFKYIFLTDYLFFPLKTVQKMAQGLPLVWSPGLEHMILATFLYSAGFLIITIIFFKKKEIP